MTGIIQKHNIKIFLILAVFVSLIYIEAKNLPHSFNFEFKNTSDIAATGKNQSDNLDKSNSAGENKNWSVNSITGERCENAGRRPFAVMLGADKEVRPLSGIASADMVFEIPVVDDGATRLMAVFGCELPAEIGSVRSARHDFIDLALAIGAIYAHWGGSHFALDKLKTGIIDSLDALPNFYNTFYRKKGIPAPYNGFTSSERLLNAAEKMGFSLENKFEGYLHEEAQSSKLKAQNSGKLVVGYPGEFAVEYKYDSTANSYLRWRGGIKEIDKNNNKQASAKNIAVMYAESRQIEGDYNDVKLEDQGKAEFYFNGEKIEGVWKKDSEKGKLYFLDDSGAEIKFTPGNIWVEIIQPERKVEWING